MEIASLISQLESASTKDEIQEASKATAKFVGTYRETPFPEYLPYCESIDVALGLLPDGAEYEVTTLYGVARVAVGLNMEPGPFYACREDGNVAIAICIAALKALEGKTDGE